MHRITDVIRYPPSRLFIVLAGFFVANTIVAELIGVKIFSWEESLGLDPFDFELFGEQGALQSSAGVLLWPFVFLLTDLLNEYYGGKGVRMLSYLTVGLVLYAFLMIYGTILLTPADWWVVQATAQGVPDSQAAFAVTFGQGLFIIVGSVTAFLLAQLTDVFVFQRIRRGTGENKLWLRATASTLVSQIIDSFVVLIVAFKLGPELVPGGIDPWPWSRILAVAVVQYAFKFVIALLLTPAIYAAHYRIDRYLGHDRAAKMKAAAAQSS